jgi:ABC-type branched-subunit amino acid transport system substrate-binding protein
MSAQIARLRQENPCAVLDLVNPANDNATFLRAYSSARIRAQLFGLGGIISSPEVWKLAGNAINGVVAVDVISPNNPYAKEFKQYYAQVQGKDQPFLSVHVQGLSSLTFLKWGIEKAKTSQGPQLKAALETMTKVPSAVGHYGYTQTWTPENHNGASVRAIVVLQFVNQTPSKLWPVWQPQA